ncbi:aminopeptidase [Eggerthia catenaformis]|uniref:aminopeptidase n=1 Tax=Eggerthia catenaformis TaxID=31973 RepID=UPI000A36CA80|nr:aminopeptidase [Eggerthia catenaformis]
MLEKYAGLIVRKGVNLQKDQILVVTGDVCNHRLVKAIAKEAYQIGAKDVIPYYTDDKISLLRYEHNEREYFKEVPLYLSDLRNEYAKKNAAVIMVTSENPDLFKEIDPLKISTHSIAMHQACKLFYDHLDMMIDRWCIVGASSIEWANKVFPEMSDQEALEALWQAIYHACKVDQDDPLSAWEIHRQSFTERINYLNSLQLETLYYQNSLGTSLEIGMNSGYLFAGGGSYTADGIYSFPNIPTEEIFTSPNYKKANGIAYASKPLNYHGTLVKDFFIELKDGKIINYDAKEGKEVLKSIIETDEGSHYLGEIALVPYHSPISDMNILFYNTLYDENAACHLAIGKGFSECIKDGLSMNKEKLKEQGINDSLTHVDFMIGTEDLSIKGKTVQGEWVDIFVNGDFAF